MQSGGPGMGPACSLRICVGTHKKRAVRMLPHSRVFWLDELSLHMVKLLGAGDGIRTRDPLLGKQLRYHCATPASLSKYTQWRSQSQAATLPLFGARLMC